MGSNAPTQVAVYLTFDEHSLICPVSVVNHQNVGHGPTVDPKPTILLLRTAGVEDPTVMKDRMGLWFSGRQPALHAIGLMFNNL